MYHHSRPGLKSSGTPDCKKGDKMKFFIAFILIAMLAGCAAFPGKTKDVYFVTKHVSINVPATETYANLKQGFRYCGPAKYGIPECVQPEKDGRVSCEIYPGNEALPKSGRIMGKISLSPNGSETKGIMQIQKAAANYENILMAWEIFMSGRVREACP
jgi:hypothetical protein